MALSKDLGLTKEKKENILLRAIDSGHRKISRWGLSIYDFEGDETVLDAGCGGGRQMKRLTELLPFGEVHGIDISHTAVTKCMKLNRKLLGKRCFIEEAPVEYMPYPDEKFDMVMTIEAIYRWNDLDAAFSEIRRVLKPGAPLIVLVEVSDPNSIFRKKNGGVTVYTPDQLTGYMRKAGFRPKLIQRAGMTAVIGTKEPR